MRTDEPRATEQKN